MTSTHVFASVALISLLIVAVDRLRNDEIDWGKLWRTIALIAIAVAAYYTLLPTAETLAVNVFGNYLAINTQYTEIVLSAFGILASTALAWYAITHHVIKPTNTTQKFMLGFSAAFVGLSYLCETLVSIGKAMPEIEKQHILFAFIGLIVIVFAIVLYLIRKNVQEIFAIPVGFVLMCCILMYAYYQYAGINVMDNISEEVNTAGGVAIIVAVALVFATIFYRSKPWHERPSYKAIALLGFFLLCYGFFSTAAYMTGGMNKAEWVATQAENRAKQKILNRKNIEDLNAIVDGYTMDGAMATIDNPHSTQQEVDAAIASIKERRKLIEKNVALQEEMEFTGNTERMKNWFNHKFPFVQDVWNYGKAKQASYDKKDFKAEKPAKTKPEPKTYSFTGQGFEGGVDSYGGIVTLCNNEHMYPGQTVKVLKGYVETLRSFDDGTEKYEFVKTQKNNLDGDFCLRMRAKPGEEFVLAVVGK